MIDISNITKLYGRFRALDNLDLKISANDFVAILGRNGAGKTTLLKIVATLLKPTGGEVHINGHNIRKDSFVILQQMGMVSHQTYIYSDLTAKENLSFYAKFYDVENPAARIQNLLEKVGLAHRSDESVRRFSRGMQQRLSIARALLHNPRILLLDEPYTGLDQKACEFLDTILLDYHQAGNCILVVTHDIERIAGIAKRAVVFDKGKVAWDQPLINLTPQNFLQRVKPFMS
ncbi:heme ABC exporter ATP-binding protein CcmA [bacterium]|nr:heme ABC exporter ATP-binding protein CcmA [bacterium]